MGLVQKKCTCLSLPTVTLRSKLTFLFLNETSNPQSLLLPSSLFLVGCSPWGREESDTTERLHFHFSLSCIGEGHGNPLQCSCLETPRDSRAWWAAVYEVAQSWTQLKRLSSSSSMPIPYCFVYYSLELQCDIESHCVLHLRKRSLELYFQIQISEQ